MFTQFIHPFTTLICGPSGSGKTTFLENRITKKNDLFIYFNRSNYLVLWEESAKPNFEKVEYFKGVPETVEN